MTKDLAISLKHNTTDHQTNYLFSEEFILELKKNFENLLITN